MKSWDSLVAQGRVQAQVLISAFTTYKLGGPVGYLAVVRSLFDLEKLATAQAAEPLPVLVVGRGSNLVVSDRGFPGLVVHLEGELAAIEIGDVVAGGGGASLPQLARAAVRASHLGLEFMVGIPGTVGGAIRQNAGCFGQEVVDVLMAAEVFDLGREELTTVEPDALELSYRRSAVTSEQVVTRATFVTRQGDPVDGERRMREITRWRKEHQPGGTLNAGSVFKNPPGDNAGRIIDSLGLKGLTIGGASVSEKHANFFVAKPGTSATEVYRLVVEVARRVREATGTDLQLEVQFVGEFEEERSG
ncbi:MAG TPA: UDP-N-acetylmuramate dehydrogenase [Acidimicrobiia bacterium]|nr:UDP-N-acetylmuramate dehydrogenase [Acidimicrobiia bacterium]